MFILSIHPQSLFVSMIIAASVIQMGNAAPITRRGESSSLVNVAEHAKCESTLLKLKPRQEQQRYPTKMRQLPNPGPLTIEDMTDKNRISLNVQRFTDSLLDNAGFISSPGNGLKGLRYLQ